MAVGGMGWKDQATGQVTTIADDEVQSLLWMRGMRGYQLHVKLSNGSDYKFDGFTAQVRKNFCDQLLLKALSDIQGFSRDRWGVPLETVDLSLKGWNWGKVEVDASALEFRVAGKRSFEIPLQQVANAMVAGKHEVALDFVLPEGASAMDRHCDQLVEMRFYIPPSATGEDSQEMSAEPEDPAQALCAAIKAGSSSAVSVAGEVLCSLPDLACLIPRGRFQLDMAASHLRMHGKSQDYRIAYSAIQKVFLLPKADDVHVLLVVALDPPIRQGQTRYPFLLLQFDKDEMIEVDLQNISADEAKTRYGERGLQMHYDAPTFEVVSSLFRSLTGQRILVPGSSFKGGPDGGSVCVRCSVKANEGHLYPLERNLLFLPKPVILIPHSDIGMVEIGRMGAGLGNPRSFDLKFCLKNGHEHSFSNIPK